MGGFFRGVLKHGKAAVGVFVVLAVVCGMCIPAVRIDANMHVYLPKSAQSSQDLDLMKQVYGNVINDAFGESQTWAILVPQGNWEAENALVEDLKALPTAFDLVETVRGLVARHCPGGDTHLVGNTMSYYDIRSVTSSDNTTVKVASILAIGAVLLIMFRSISIPAILIFFVLPLLFTGGDKIVQHTSYKIGFYQGGDESHSDGSEPLPTRA